MHFNFDFSAVQVIWTMTFAALLVLLVVLLGRDRMRRYPWFTASIVLLTLDLLGKRLLFGRLPQLTLAGIFIVIADLVVLVGLLVVVELGRSAFAGMRSRNWVVGALLMLAVGAGVLYVWGPWPNWKTLTANSELALLELMQLGAQKGQLLVSLLTVELGLLVVLFGRRFKAGWRSHTQQIVIGLSTAAIAQLSLQVIQQIIVKTAVIHTQAELDQARELLRRLSNANGSVYVAVLLWWIVCLWNDEPGAAVETPSEIPTAEGVLETAEEPFVAAEEQADDVMEEEHENDL
jgi:hypothetical protein